MATHRIAFPADYHYPGGRSESEYDSALDHLSGTINPDTIIWGGDQIDETTLGAVPHFQDQDVRDFWTKVENKTNLDITYQVPGNHDIPVDHYHDITAEYLGEEKTQLPKAVQPIDGLTIIMVNSQGPGFVQGGHSGVGRDHCYVPLHDLQFLVNQVINAHSRGDIVVVASHAPFWFAPHDANVDDNGDFRARNATNDLSTYSLEEVTMRVADITNSVGTGQSYFICQNYMQILRELSQRSPMIVLAGHVKQSAYETYQNVQGVYQTFIDHWAYETGSTETAYLDVDTSTGRCIYKTVEMDKTENTVMDVTPSW